MKTICVHGVNLSRLFCRDCVIDECLKAIAALEKEHAEDDRERAAVTVEGEYVNKNLNRLSITIDMPAIPLITIDSVKEH